MQNIAISSLIICMSFPMASTLAQHNQVMPHLRVLHNLKGSQKHKAYDWTPNLLLNNYSSEVSSNISRMGGSSKLASLRKLSINGENSKLNYQFLPSYSGASALQNFLKIYKKEKNGKTLIRAAPTTFEKLNSVEAPDSYLFLKEESSITFSTNIDSRFGKLQLPHNFFESNNNNMNLVIIPPNVTFASLSFELESVPSSRSATMFPEYSSIKRQKVNLREKRAVASSANFCHSHHLHKCGEPVIQKFKLELDAATKCKIREDFLDCMVRQRKEGCFSMDESLYTNENTDLLRSKIKSHLWSAHGCLLF